MSSPNWVVRVIRFSPVILTILTLVDPAVVHTHMHMPVESMFRVHVHAIVDMNLVLHILAMGLSRSGPSAIAVGLSLPILIIVHLLVAVRRIH